MPRPTILYAEDDQVTRENYSLALEQYFHKVYTAKDGKEALALYYKERPDVLLLDVNMPCIDGLEIVKIIREKDTKTLIVILTAHSDKERLLKAIPLGLTQYLVKPVKDDLFRKTIYALLAQVKAKETVSLSDGFIWDQTYNELTYRRIPVNLSQKEMLLISLLAASPGHYLSHEMLISDIWYGEEIDTSHTNKLAQLVYRLNTKLREKSREKVFLIENSYALGYRLLS